MKQSDKKVVPTKFQQSGGAFISNSRSLQNIRDRISKAYQSSSSAIEFKYFLINSRFAKLYVDQIFLFRRP